MSRMRWSEKASRSSPYGEFRVPSGLGATDTLNVRRLVSKIFPLQDAVTALDSLRRGEQMKVLIKPER